MTHRPDQVASLIQRAVQTVLGRGLSDPRIRGLVSVTKVRVDHALSQAQVHVSVLPAEDADLTLKGLQHAAPRIRTQVGKSVQLRRMPQLSFHLDESIKKQAQLIADQEVRKAKAELKKEVARLSLERAQRLIQEQINADDQVRLVKDYINNIAR